MKILYSGIEIGSSDFKFGFDTQNACLLIAPSLLANVSITLITNTTISLSWLPPPCELAHGPFLHYSVIHYPDNCDSAGAQEIVEVSNTTALHITLTDLQPYTKYCVEVAGVNKGWLTGAYSKNSLRTLQGCK